MGAGDNQIIITGESSSSLFLPLLVNNSTSLSLSFTLRADLSSAAVAASLQVLRRVWWIDHWPRQNFSLHYQDNVKQTSNERKKKEIINWGSDSWSYYKFSRVVRQTVGRIWLVVTCVRQLGSDSLKARDLFITTSVHAQMFDRCDSYIALFSVVGLHHGARKCISGRDPPHWFVPCYGECLAVCWTEPFFCSG